MPTNDNNIDLFGNTKKVFDKNFEDFCSQSKMFGDQFKALLDNAMKELNRTTDKVIKTCYPEGDETVCYQTTISAVTENITNTFPSKRPSENDIYWKIHKEQVDLALATRKDLQIKVIETIGNTVKGLFNPISVSNVDLVQIVQAVLSKK